MNRSPGVWKYEDAALILIDSQKEMFDTVWKSPVAGHARTLVNSYLADVQKLAAS